MNLPLVSIIVMCHNHGLFVRDAITSAFDQTYSNIQVIVVDDGSQDQSTSIINAMAEQGYNFAKVLFLDNMGYCKAFNHGLVYADGEFVIDLAADDVLLPKRVEKGLQGFSSQSSGVDFCDAYYIDESSTIVGTHFKRNSDGRLLSRVPQGDVFRHVLERYFICAPGMMIRKNVLDDLGGYDESLYYEDFDFWVRSSRCYDYHFTNQLLVKKRVLKNSMSKSQYLPGSKMLPTTLKVCQKAFELCQSEDDFRSLGKRIRYELRQAVLSNNYSVAADLHTLLGEIEGKSPAFRVFDWFIDRGWNFSMITRLMRKAR